jgi:hypothetical protein
LKLEHLKDKKELLSTALLVVSVLAAIMILVKVVGFFVTSARAAGAVEQAIRHSAPDATNMTAQLGKSRKVADTLKKSNLFVPPSPRENPIKMVMGILGDEALINGKWYKTGDKVGDAKILAVNPTSVETEWDGKKKTFSPIDAGAAPGPSGSSSSKRPTMTARSSNSAGTGSAQMVVTKSSPVTKSTKSEKPAESYEKKMSKVYKGFSDSQKEAFKRVLKERGEQYKRMDSDEKAHFKARIIERISHSGKR